MIKPEEIDELLLSKLNLALDNIRPYLQKDGGDISIVGLDDTILQVEMKGTCISCPMSAMTLKAGVEETIKKEVPEISKVVAVNI